MTAGSADALDDALELLARPDAYARLRKCALPDSILLLIRIAAGDPNAMRIATERTRVSPGVMFDATSAYLRRMLLAADADHYRVLGVAADASTDTIKEHHRWLMRWLHPDRESGRDGETGAQRVNRAWHELRSLERRREYDRRRLRQLRPLDDPRISAPTRGSRPYAPMPRTQRRAALSPRALRYLPAVVLGVMALLAGGSLATWRWLERVPDADNPVDSRTVRDTQPPSRDVSGIGQAQSGSNRRLLSAEAMTASSSRTVPGPGSVPIAESRVAATPTTVAPQGIPMASMRGEPIEANDARPYAEIADQLGDAYASGNLERFMGLFAPHAFDDERALARIADDYRRLFEQTDLRRLDLGELIWSRQGERIVGDGQFDARIVLRGHANARHLRGRIRIELVPVGGHWKIHRLDLRGDPR